MIITDIIKYIPTETNYLVIAIIQDENLGKLIGYTSGDGELYFRSENDFEKFEKSDDYISIAYEEPVFPTDAKVKIDGEWVPSVWDRNKIEKK